MKTITTILLSFLFMTGSIFAQKTNDGGSTGGNNKGNTPKDNTDKKGGSNDNALYKITKVLFGAYQGHLLASSNKKPWIKSFELMAHGGLVGNSINAIPRVKLNYGALSGDVRYDYLGNNVWVSQNIDILAEFNIIVGNFKMTLAQGIMYDMSIEKSYHESFVGIDLGIMNRQIIISPEFRFAYDWENRRTINSEFTLKGGYRILNMSKLAVYLNAAGGYRNNNIVLNGGLNLIFQ
jgi:hypothetical protein